MTGRRLRLSTLLAFAGFFLIGAGWAIALPWDGGPDEQAHITRAVGVVSGDAFAEPVFLGGDSRYPGAKQHVPVGLVHHSPPCFAWKPYVSAACMPPTPVRARETTVTGTTEGRYPPTYYALVGLPLRWWPDDTGLLLARLVSSAASAGFLAFAVRAVLGWVRRPMMLTGLIVVTTPMTMSLAGVINPNGLEITAAIALWTALIPLFLDDRQPDRRLLILAAVSASVVATVRPAGSMFVVMSLGVLTLTAGWSRIRRLAKSRGMWVMVVVAGMASVASAVWTLAMGAAHMVPQPEHYTPADAMRILAADRMSFYLKSMVGIFGWVDTEPPGAFYATWFGIAGFVMISALVAGRLVDKVRILLIVAVSFAPPVVTDVIGSKSQGLEVQGRYILAGLVGAGLLAGYVIDDRGLFSQARTRSVIGWVAGPALVAQIAALAYTMIRFQHGLWQAVPAVNPFSGDWHPRFGSATALVTAIAGLAALAALMRLAIRQYAAEGSAPAPALEERVGDAHAHSE